MYYIGIDPGKTGGLAAINEEGGVVFAHTFNTWKESMEHINNPFLGKVHVAIEKVHAMPMQGVSSMFTFGMNFGGWLALLETNDITHILVPPQTWMKALLGSFAKGESKAKALEYAQRRWPHLNLKKSQSGIVDALCLAIYARKDHLGIL